MGRKKKQKKKQENLGFWSKFIIVDLFFLGKDRVFGLCLSVFPWKTQGFWSMFIGFSLENTGFLVYVYLFFLGKHRVFCLCLSVFPWKTQGFWSMFICFSLENTGFLLYLFMSIFLVPIGSNRVFQCLFVLLPLGVLDVF